MLNTMIDLRPPPLLKLPIEPLKTGCGIAEYLFFHAETDIISPPFEQFFDILIQARCVF